MKKFFVVLLVVSFSCASLGGALFAAPKPKPVEYKEIPFLELEQAVATVCAKDGKSGKTPSEGFIVDAYIWSDHRSVYIGSTPAAKKYYDGSGMQNRFTPYEEYKTNASYEKIYPEGFIENSLLDEQYDLDKTYRIYIEAIPNGGKYELKKIITYITKIEGLRTKEEVDALIAQEKADKEVAKEAEKKAEAEALEAKQNPNKLDRSSYKVITVEDFSFDMAAGKLAVGSKVAFDAKFLTKPTGTSYNFQDVNMLITISSNHNFVRDIPERCFGAGSGFFGWEEQRWVAVYVTVKKAGKNGECTVDIMKW
jgi:hypothetical protein